MGFRCLYARQYRSGLYNPGAMGAEIKKVLGVEDFVPAKINDLDSAMGAIEE